MALGIAKDYDGAQSCAESDTSNGMVVSRLYKMHVEIDGNDGIRLVDPENPVNRPFHRTLEIYVLLV